ncbi:unnamed protein product [Caenorhabditis auriculariae]|uniref:SH3 domain-containing protein n=1 Tax=Caenorhabditis auriculariae TaxID=2777116 RepID=A0A8S1HWJ7_9PELO|nr:unnamed protein product [Caenorhabditis auriculariae]
MVPYGENEGRMSTPDLHMLIETRIPEQRNQMENTAASLNELAAYLEHNYITSKDKDLAFKKTQNDALQSLASVAYQINTLGRDLLDMLDLQTEKINHLTHQVKLVNEVVNIQKEKSARREIGYLTKGKLLIKHPKILDPGIQMKETVPRYKRTPIDYSVLDNLGHGVRSEPPRAGVISRAASSISGSGPHFRDYGNGQNYAAYGPSMQYEQRTANINNTLGRNSMRSGHLSMAPSDYRVPQVNMGSHHNSGSDYGTMMSDQYGGSQYGASEYSSYPSDRYGTIRANGGSTVGHQGHPRSSLFAAMDSTTTVASMGSSGSGGVASRGHHSSTDSRPDSPGLPLPPPQLSAQSQHYGGYIPPGTMNGHRAFTSGAELPPPPDSLLRSIHEDELPPPPPPASSYGAVRSIGSHSSGTIGGADLPPFGMTPSEASLTVNNFFDSTAGWVPPDEYMEKALVLYEYVAKKFDELTLRENAVVYVLRKNEDGWFEGVLDGVTGLFPGNYVQTIM